MRCTWRALLRCATSPTCNNRVPGVAALTVPTCPSRQDLEYDAVLVSPPSKFVAPTIEAQVDCLADVLKYCPNTPAFYYHYPIVYRDEFDLVELFEIASVSCPTLCGCKLSG